MRQLGNKSFLPRTRLDFHIPARCHAKNIYRSGATSEKRIARGKGGRRRARKSKTENEEGLGITSSKERERGRKRAANLSRRDNENYENFGAKIDEDDVDGERNAARRRRPLESFAITELD